MTNEQRRYSSLGMDAWLPLLEGQSARCHEVCCTLHRIRPLRVTCIGQVGPSWHRCYCRCTLLKLSLAGNRLWEQWLVNRHGVGRYDARTHESLGDNWPPELGADYRDFTLKFQERTHEVLLKILQALALGLGWEESFFNEV